MVALREFKRHYPRVFRGGPDQIAAEDWINETGNFLDTLAVGRQGGRPTGDLGRTSPHGRGSPLVDPGAPPSHNLEGLRHLSSSVSG